MASLRLLSFYLALSHVAFAHVSANSLSLLPRASLAGSLNDTVLATPCISQPWGSGCTSFTYSSSDVDADISQMCTSMRQMPGCTINDMCKNTTSIQSSDICKPFSVLADLCKTDMPRMTGCRAYTSMCGPLNSTVAQCTQIPPIKSLPSTDTVNSAVRSICSSMSMDGCDKCKFATATSYATGCDLFSTYSQLCLSMPDMTECAPFKNFCTSNPSVSLCGSSSSATDAAPVMMMYFHTKAAYVLFYSWIPRTTGDYAWSFIVIALMGIVLEGIIAYRPMVEKYADGSSSSNAPQKLQKEVKANSSSKASRWLVTSSAYVAVWFIRLVETAISYLLMLAAMSFNVVVFIAVIVGLATGHVVFLRSKRANRVRNTDGGNMADESNTLCC